MRLLREWIDDLPLQQQAVLVLACRGCDGMPKEDQSKRLLRYYRFTVFSNARPLAPDNVFMVKEAPSAEEWKALANDLDGYPVHWLMHFIHGIEVLAYRHPNTDISGYWFFVYSILVDALHLTVETAEQMNHRLRH